MRRSIMWGKQSTIDNVESYKNDKEVNQSDL